MKIVDISPRKFTWLFPFIGRGEGGRGAGGRGAGGRKGVGIYIIIVMANDKG